MSVLIKGMEMPKSCDKCELMTANYGCAFVGAVGGESYRKRAWDCPLVEVPEHGRLIDADALENEAQMRLLECNKYDNQFQKPYEVMRAIALAPTIIESEE